MNPDAPIFSLSWGGPRRFVLKPKKNVVGIARDFVLRDGDLLVMGGTTQKTHKHEVPKWRKTKDHFLPGKRINWTLRAFVEK